MVSEGLASLWSTLFPCYLQFLTCKTSTASPVSQVFVHQFLFSFMHSPSLLFSFHHLCSVISLNYICLYSPSIQKHPSPLLFINHQSVCCSPLFFCSSHHPSILYFCPFVFSPLHCADSLSSNNRGHCSCTSCDYTCLSRYICCLALSALSSDSSSSAGPVSHRRCHP